MNSMDIVNGLIFQGLEIRNESFNDRLISQKKIYLLQQLGTNLGYTYNWYIRGPYSPSLTAYIYSNFDYLKNERFDEYSINESAEKHILTINNLATLTPETLLTSTWYELLASLSYLHENRDNWNISSKESLITHLREQKPKYSLDECNAAIKELENILPWSFAHE